MLRFFSDMNRFHGSIRVHVLVPQFVGTLSKSCDQGLPPLFIDHKANPARKTSDLLHSTQLLTDFEAETVVGMYAQS